MKQAAFISGVVLLLSATVFATSPGTDLWLPSVGHGPGQMGSQWRTDVWIAYPTGSGSATVDIYFFPRGETNSWPPESRRISLSPGETREFADIIGDLFGKANAFGALRVQSTAEILVTSRIYSAGLTVVDPASGQQKTGTAGQFFAGLPSQAAMGLGETTDIQGVAEDSSSRTNVGWVEVTGNPCSLQVERVDGNGTTLASQTYSVQPYAVVQKSSILNQLGGGGGNQRLRFTVVSGNCRVLVFGSRLDNSTNDPSTIEMRTAAVENRSSGTFVGALLENDSPLGGLRFTLHGGVVSGFAANGTVTCSGIPYTLDFGPSSQPAQVSNGNFNLALTEDYFDGPTKILTVQWEISGTLRSNGTADGAVVGTVTFSTGDWQTCSGTTQSWKASWFAP
ncbi:MAG: hypothetical protein ACUVRY_01440 [Thermoanaerobaculaceae bacterium]